ncbi:uncharacterized protein LOC114720081 [Neltuma alba]|uniref:uncharacterized protein LOC114720081 n=1 Tax=Neltuma alba TaxID=207710 RepID=UPI0010A54E4C|nr:uncharacterized protein LOC114720081 [Prosopis alba]
MRVAERPTFSDLSATDEDLFEQLARPCRVSRSACPKVQKVAYPLRNRKDFAEHCCPRMLSLGPIHHGESHLKSGEKYKLMWASTYVQEDRERARYLHGKIAENIEELQNLYNEDAIGPFNDQQLVRMLFLDGCALLQILKHPADPERLNAKVDQLVLVHRDALLLENQLPFRVLQLLSDVPDPELLKDMHEFLRYHHLSRGKRGQNRAEGDSHHQCAIDVPVPAPAHLLDLLRNVVAGLPPAQEKRESAPSTSLSPPVVCAENSECQG